MYKNITCKVLNFVPTIFGCNWGNFSWNEQWGGLQATQANKGVWCGIYLPVHWNNRLIIGYINLDWSFFRSWRDPNCRQLHICQVNLPMSRRSVQTLGRALCQVKFKLPVPNVSAAIDGGEGERRQTFHESLWYTSFSPSKRKQCNFYESNAPFSKMFELHHMNPLHVTSSSISGANIGLFIFSNFLNSPTFRQKYRPDDNIITEIIP